MISGTIHSAGKLMEMTQKWEQKKKSGNILKQENLSTEEKQLQMYQEQLEKDREASEYSAIYNKVASGQKLSPSEEDKFRFRDAKAYMEYKADQQERAAFEERLKHCTTKDEAQRLHQSKIQSNLTELKSVVNNPDISKSEKLKVAQRIQGDTAAVSNIFHEFIKSDEFKDMPTEQELMIASKQESSESKSVDTSEDVTSDNKETSHINIDAETESVGEMQKLKNELTGNDDNWTKINVKV